MIDTPKSQLSIMLSLMKGLLKDLHAYHQYSSCDHHRDVSCVEDRTQAEGLGFLTKVLPRLGSALDAALQTGTFHMPVGFKTQRGTKLPRFLQGLFLKVFSLEGMLLERPCIQSVKDIRQVCSLLYKYELPYEESLIITTVQKFLDIEEDIEELPPNAEVQGSVYYANQVVTQIFQSFEYKPTGFKNGPGAVANGLHPSERYKPSRFYPGLDRCVPYCSSFYYNDRHLFDCFEDYRNLPWSDRGTARLLVVPKDSRGPRIISAEQSEFMLYQQSLRGQMYPFLERNRYTAGQINFTDQSVNADLALEASRTGEFATLDLSAASDRLTFDLVEALFEDTGIMEMLRDTRSVATDLGVYAPAGTPKILTLRKFAPMGSALCFPIQAVCYFALLVGRMMALGERLSTAAKLVWVYGDDIIVPTEFATEAIEVLESVGLKINQEKSCTKGHFRESCGTDGFHGVDVTPCKIKKVWNPLETVALKKGKNRKKVSRPKADTIASWVDVCNNLYMRGYWNCSAVAKTLIDGVIKLPFTNEQTPVLGFFHPNDRMRKARNGQEARWNESLQCYEITAPCIESKTRKKAIPGWEQCLRHAWDNTHDVWDAPFTASAFTDRGSVKIKNRRVPLSYV